MKQTAQMEIALNRGLGNFQITEDDLIHNMIQRERKRLENVHSSILSLKDKGVTEIVTRIYKSEGHFRKYYENRGKAKCGNSFGHRDNIPTAFKYPKTTCAAYTVLFLTLFYVTCVVLNTTFTESGDKIGFRLMVLVGWVIYLASVILTSIHVWKDYKLVEKFHGEIEKCNQEIDDSLKEFCNKLSVNHRFYLDNLIEEMSHQKRDYENQLNTVESDLKNSARGPRDAIKAELNKLYSQLKNTNKMKGIYTEEDIEAVRNQLQLKIDNLRGSTDQFKELEAEIIAKRGSVQDGIKLIEETKLALISHREATKDINEYMEGIQESLGDHALDWGVIEKSRYERDLIRILNNLTDMEESMQQLTTTVTRATNILPTGNDYLAIAA